MSPLRSDPNSEERRLIRGLRKAALLEGSTLVILLFIAVPLKHLAGFPMATSIMGPLHGMAFLIYLWMLMQSQTASGWSNQDRFRLFVAAFIPFGAIVSRRALKKKELALSFA